jgi:transposase
MTTKILALTDAFGRLVRFALLPGQRHDTIGVEPLIDGLSFGGLIADKAFDADWIINEMNRRDARICISQHPNRKAPLSIDLEVYKSRHLIENFFAKIKEFKRIACNRGKIGGSQACAAMTKSGRGAILGAPGTSMRLPRK